MIERSIYSHNEIAVTYTCLKVLKKDYSINKIYSVNSCIQRPKYILARVSMFGGIPFLFGDNFLPLMGALLMMIGLISFKKAKVLYALSIVTMDGNYQPYQSEDFVDIENIVAALNVALIMRDAAI